MLKKTKSGRDDPPAGGKKRESCRGFFSGEKRTARENERMGPGLNFSPGLTFIGNRPKVFPDFYSFAGENYLQTLENTDFFRLQKIFIIIFCIYANKSFYNNKNLDILPILAYIH